MDIMISNYISLVEPSAINALEFYLRFNSLLDKPHQFIRHSNELFRGRTDE